MAIYIMYLLLIIKIMNIGIIHLLNNMIKWLILRRILYKCFLNNCFRQFIIVYKHVFKAWNRTAISALDNYFVPSISSKNTYYYVIVYSYKENSANKL